MSTLLLLLVTGWQSLSFTGWQPGYTDYRQKQTGSRVNSPPQVRSSQTYPAGLEPAAVVINEILFNPRLQGVDFVEIYNRSDQLIDLKGWRLANRNAAGNIASARPVSASTHLMKPGEFRVLTENPSVLQEQYSTGDPSVFIQMASLPSYPNASGTVVLLNDLDDIVDEVSYSEKWHFTLLNNLKGVSLERMNPDGPSGQADNWHSAASSAGYATPGYRNSQLYLPDITSEAISVEPLVFSPDNDGYNDYAVISYRFPQPGYVCSLTIFSRDGVAVRHLTRNVLCGTSGFFKWDGLNDKNQPLGIGTYIMLAEVFNLNGKLFRSKLSITLAKKLR